MTKKPIIKKTTKAVKAPVKKKTVAKIVPEKNKHHNHWFVIFCISGLTLAVIIFLLIRINFYYDDLSVVANQDTTLLEQSYVNKLPSAETAADPTVSGAFNINNNQPVWNQTDAYLGNVRGAVKIFYFADYNSQTSRAQEKDLKQLVANYPEQVLLVRKDFPSTEPLSIQSAKAARCAQEQGGFWKYHDALLAYLNHDNKITQDVLYDENAPSRTTRLVESKTFLADLAEGVNLDLKKFNKCFEEANNAVLSNNISEGESLGISGVPTIYVNGQQFVGALSYQDLERLIKIVIAK